MRLYNYDITFSEVPDKVSLTLAFSGCPNRCEGCHSPWLREDVGDLFTYKLLYKLLNKYSEHVDCVTFLGGEEWLEFDWVTDSIKGEGLDICLYTSKTTITNKHIRYLKTGEYIKSLGGLSSATTNQKMVDLFTGEDITYKYQRS